MDEARHAKLYFSVLKTPLRKEERRQIAIAVRASVREFLDSYNANLLQFIASAHVAELRTFQSLLLSSSDEHKKQKFDNKDVNIDMYYNAINRITEDEKQHIQYTYEILNDNNNDNSLDSLLASAMIEYGMDSSIWEVF